MSEPLLFPDNPAHNTIYQASDGSLYQYDQVLHSWVTISSASVNTPLATSTNPGAMAAADLKKLNRLVIPTPQSTLIGNDCDAPFITGNIGLTSGDDFVRVNGNVDLRNIDEFGEEISQTVPFHIHQNTYGFNFSLDLPALVEELKERGQYKAKGETGDPGLKGSRGPAGIDEILTGPPGQQGEQGNAPVCDLTIEPEPIQVQPRRGLQKALSSVYVVDDPEDPTKFYLQFDRQDLGVAGAAVSKFNVKQRQSTWVMCVTSVAGGAQQVFYLDIEPLVNSIRDKFRQEVELLRKGYEDVVRHWVQTMSDLFDEQKDALCCALEYCTSRTQNAARRGHMESLAATALPNAKIRLTPRVENQSFSESIESYSVGGQLYSLSPALHVGADNGIAVELPAGSYAAVISELDLQVDDKHYVPLAVQYTSGGERKISRLMDKGIYPSLKDAQAAYEGLNVGFQHDGGQVTLYLHMMPPESASGMVQVAILASSVQDTISHMDAATIRSHQQAWQDKQGHGGILTVGGQDYILVQLTDADSALAWPTLDRQTFVGITDAQLESRAELNQHILSLIADGQLQEVIGNPQDITTVLLPQHAN